LGVDPSGMRTRGVFDEHPDGVGHCTIAVFAVGYGAGRTLDLW